MRRISVPLLATVALAFGCASSNSQSNDVQNPDDAGQVQYDVGSDGADGGDADAGDAGGSKRKPKDQMGTSGADAPVKAVKKLAATKPPRPEEPAAEPKTKPKRTGRTSPHGLLAQFYGIDASVGTLPDFASLGDATSASIVENLDIMGRFVGAPGQTFAVNLTGSLNITQGAEYNLCLTSSDGSQLLIEDTLIVDNDGVHESKEVCEVVYMEPGEYAVSLRYFNVSEEIALKWTWDLGGAGAQVVPKTSLFKPEGADAAVGK